MVSLKTHIARIFILLIGLASSLSIYHGYHSSAGFLLKFADREFARISEQASERLVGLMGPAIAQLNIAVSLPITGAVDLQQRLQQMRPLLRTLDQTPELASVYVGYADGEFFLLRSLNDAAKRERFQAPAAAAYMVQSLERRVPTSTPQIPEANDPNVQGQFLFLDGDSQVIERRKLDSYRYDPRLRPWYEEAEAADTYIRTDAYVFFTDQKIGVTFAMATANKQAVVGMDVVLDTLSGFLASRLPTPSARILLLDDKGRVVAYPQRHPMLMDTEGKPRMSEVVDLQEPVLDKIMRTVEAQKPLVNQAERQNLTIDVDDQQWLASLQNLPSTAGRHMRLIVAAPVNELLGPARDVLVGQLVIGGSYLLLTLPLIWWMARRMSAPLEVLAQQAKAIRSFDFSDHVVMKSKIREVSQLAKALDAARDTVREFMDTSTRLALESKLDLLLENVLSDTRRAARAVAGAIYLMDDDEVAVHRLAFEMDYGCKLAEAEHFPTELRTDQFHAITQAIHKRRTQVIMVEGVSELVVPLVNRENECVGVLCLVLDKVLGARADDIINPRVAFVEAIAGNAAVAIETRRLIAAQKTLLAALIELLASAIDAKSPYTGGHCQRVPVLAELLAEAAHGARHGPFASFIMDEVDREALHTAAWLHDCGKITTPEYVVDKSTKLETIYNRIHEVRTRFEVLKRDAEIASLKAIIAGADATAEQARLTLLLADLDEEFAFVARCNQGGEFMRDEDLQRLQQIAKRSWQRTLDKSLGLSHDELQLLQAQQGAATELPVTEQLLMDLPEHQVPRPPTEQMPADNPWGFNMAQPQLKFNLGEVYNLSTGRGTLTAEERYIINFHIVQTIIMLNRLPFPKPLRNVPEIAGGHHERMDGKGYPRGLQASQMSTLARAMAIADIFEALTARDRPYKSPKSMRESLAIMRRMVLDNHIDPQLYDLFLTSGVWKVYGDKYLQPEQMDCTDIEEFRVPA